MQTDTIRNILIVYGLLACASVLLCFPFGIPVALGGLLWLLALILTWALRFRKPKDSPIYQHMFYINRTIWGGLYIASLTSTAAMMYVYINADHGLYKDIINDMAQGISYSYAQMEHVLSRYVHINLGIFIIAGIICFLPPTAYTLYRVYHGVICARGGLPLAHPRSWL